jgi:hypothetical protein
MALDDELRHLFASDRMDVPVRPDAEHIIVAGARRVRRRRIAATATGGAVVLIVIAGVALAGGQPGDMPPATRKPTTASTTSAELVKTSDEAPPAAPPVTSAEDEPEHTPPSTDSSEETDTSTPGLAFPVFGPTGFRGLELGQTLEEAQATGVLGDQNSPTGPYCDYYHLMVDGEPAGWVLVSDTVQAIDSDALQTPEGIGAGSTLEQAATAYPDVGDQFGTQNGHAIVAAPGNDNARYNLQFADGKIVRVALEADGLPCHG